MPVIYDCSEASSGYGAQRMQACVRYYHVRISDISLRGWANYGTQAVSGLQQLPEVVERTAGCSINIKW